MTVNRATAYTLRPAPRTYDPDWLDQEHTNQQQAIPSSVVRTTTVNTTQLPNDRVIRVDTSGGARSVTLMAATNAPSFPLTIKKISNDVNAVTVVGTVDGVVNPTFTVQYQSWTLMPNGASWDII